MAYYRLKSSFTAGEISPRTFSRTEFDRYKNGCRKLYNSLCLAQGPALNRSGTKFLFDLSSLGVHATTPEFRLIPFVYNSSQAYVLIFFKDTTGAAKLVFGTSTGLVTYSGTPPTECPPGTPVTYTPGDIVSVDMPAGWDLSAFDYAQYADEMYFTQSGVKPHILKRYGSECWELVDATTGMTSMPADWSDVNGWPERVTFHQQRLIFAANKLRGQTVWCSRAGDPTHFGNLGSSIVDADAVTFTLASGLQDRIVWLVAGKSLYIGTLGAEWTVQGSSQPALTPSNINAIQQTNNGSEPNKPLKVGLATIFIERHGRRVNEFVYDYTLDSYKASDLSVVSTHVTDDYSIVDWAYQQTPNNIIWCIRADGDLLGLTYQREHKVVGWHHHDTLGAFKHAACIPGQDREDDLFFIVKRVIGGANKFYLEVLAPEFNAEDAEWGRFVDSHVVYQGVATGTITGLSHLEGLEVSILADGLVHPSRTVASGSVTLDDEYSHVVVGIPYESEIRPVLDDIATQNQGTSLSRFSRVTSLAVDLYRSLGCTIGRIDSETGVYEEQVPFRNTADAYEQQIPLVSDWVRLGGLEGADWNTQYFIKQTQPLPLMVRAIVDEVEVHE